MRQFWAGLGRSHQGVGAFPQVSNIFFVEEERVELMNGFRKQEDEEMDVRRMILYHQTDGLRRISIFYFCVCFLSRK